MSEKHEVNPCYMVVDRVDVNCGLYQDFVKIWNRGEPAGEIAVAKGDGKIIAERLKTNQSQLRIEPARDTHLMASIHIVRNAGDFIKEDREGVWIEVDFVGINQDSEQFVDLRVSHIIWHEDGVGIQEDEFVTRFYPDRAWGKKKRVELISKRD
jgi:hypothetical protein